MRIPILVCAAVGVTLSGCINAQPVALSDDNPANPQAGPGWVDAPTAIADYKSPEDLAIRATAESREPQGDMGNMQGMPGMSGMGNMPDMGGTSGTGGMNMQHGGASHGTAPQ